jgi:type IV secretion system protein VirB9
MPRFGLALVAAILVLGGVAQATVIPMPSSGDPRIRVVPYAPDEVVLLNATLGYAVTVEFGDGERVETVSIGDSLGWQVTPNRRANLLFVKPIERAAPTDMTVVTNLRTYTLELRARPRSRGDDKGVIYALKFDYPEPAVAAAEPPPPPKPPEPPKDVNHAYSFQGSQKGLPLRVFDDGQSTYFSFAETTDYPAIFAVDPDNKEASVNVAQRDGFVVIDRLAPAFVLRRGADVTRIINGGYHPDDARRTELRRLKN